MKEIKFRAWDEETELMYYSDKCWENAEATFVCETDGTLKCYVPETIEATHDESEHIVGREIFPIMQYTGLKDKNGKELNWWEGDLISQEKSRVIYKIFWNESKGQWYACRINFISDDNHGSPLYLFAERDFETFGDIHTKPELIEQK